MLRSIATVTLSGTLQEKLYAIAAAKFDLVEIFDNELAFHDGSLADLRELIGQLGLGISLYQPFFDLEAVPDEVFKTNLARVERKFDIMVELGAPMMLLSSNASRSAIDDDERAAAQLHAIAERAAARGLKIGYEAIAWGAHIRTYKDAWRLVRRCDHPALGVILDAYHTLAQGVDLGGIADIPADKIAFVQLSDAPDSGADIATAGRHLRSLPGQGVLDVVGFAARCVDAGYRGPLSIEVFNDELRAAPTRLTAVEAMRALLHVEEGLRLKGLAGRVELADPEPPPTIAGVAFLEFAVDEASAAELGGWLCELGFTRVGRHRTKSVWLYQHGGALIVLNANPDSFANAYRHLHGVSVCAVGLKVADREALLRRAEAFSYRRHKEQAGPGEYEMPAVRAPDGSLINLIDGTYDPWQDFIAEGAATEAWVTGFDHIGRVVPAAQFDSWVLYFRILLGLEPEPQLDLPDPHGVVHSRAISNAERTVRFPLGFSDGTRTVAARSLATFAGAGVNQIAFSTDDIFKAVEAMRARGAKLLPIPANYYVELASETDLAPERIARLREHHVLYDRDEQGGEFLHAYTETFGDRFFFELVQRVGGYARYGEANAPVRMAAQARRKRAGD